MWEGSEQCLLWESRCGKLNGGVAPRQCLMWEWPPRPGFNGE